MTKQLWVEPRLEELDVGKTLNGVPFPLGEGTFVPEVGPPVPVS